MNNRFIEPVLTELSEPTNFFFEQTPELDAATGVIGHLRIDFGRNGKQFLHTWKQPRRSAASHGYAAERCAERPEIHAAIL